MKSLREPDRCISTPENGVQRRRSFAPQFVLALILPLSANAQVAFQVGIGTHIGAYPLAATQSALAAAGATIRDDENWGGIENQPGQLQYPSDRQNLDQLISSVIARKELPLIVLPRGNALYDNGGLITSAPAIAAFAAYAGFVAQHFKGQRIQFEIWNEWSHDPAGAPQPYVNLLRAAYKAIKQANPAAVVLGGGIGGGYDQATWLTQFAQAGGLNYLDGFSVHPYVQCHSRTRPRAPVLSRPAGSASSVNPSATASAPDTIIGATPEESIDWVDQVRAILDGFTSKARIPIYITEVGWPTTSKAHCGFPENVVAAYLERFFLLAKTRSWVAGVWWYDLFDDGSDPNNAEFRFGLLNTDATRKSAFSALANMADILTATAVPVLTTGSNGELTVSGLTASGGRFSVAWLPTDSFSSQQTWSVGANLLKAGYHLVGTQSASSVSISATPLVLIHGSGP